VRAEVTETRWNVRGGAGVTLPKTVSSEEG